MQRSEALVSVPLVGGVDTKSDAKSVLPTKLLQLENGEFTKRGSIRKRPGFVALSNRINDSITSGTVSAPISDARALGKFRDQLALFTPGGTTYTYQEPLDRWAQLPPGPAGTMTPCAARVAPGVFTLKEQLFSDVLETSSLSFYCWEEGTTLFASVYTADGGFVDSSSFASTRAGRWVRLGGVVLLLAASGVNLVVRRFPLADPRAGFSVAAVNATTDLVAAHSYDVRPENNYTAIVTWIGTGNVMRVGRMNTSRVFTGTGSLGVFGATTDVSLALVPELDRGVVAYTDAAGTTNANVFSTVSFTSITITSILDETSNTFAGLRITAAHSTTNKVIVLTERTAASNSNFSVNWVELDTSAPPATIVSQRIRHAHLAAHAFNFSTKAGCWLGFDSTLQSSYFLYLFAGSNAELVGRALPGAGAGVLSRVHLAGSNQVDSNSTWVTALGFRRQLALDTPQTGNNANTSFFEHKGFSRVYADFDHKPRSVDVGQALYIANAQLNTFDGTNIVESGFHLFPEGVTTTNNGAGNLAANGIYGYKVYYEWYNTAGERFKSLAIPFTHTVSGSNQTVRLTIPSLTHTRKLLTGTTTNALVIKVYRTTANASSLYYLVSSNNPTAVGANGWITNVTNADTIAFDDNLADASITNREVDYLSDLPQPLANASPEAGEFILEAQNRIWLAGGTLGENTVAFSKLRADFEPVEFALELQLSIPEDGGPVTGLGQLNNNVVVFKRDRIYVVTSNTNGPDNTGDGAYLVEHVTSDTGCTSVDTIVQVPDGLLFLGAKGIYRLSQGFQVDYVGFEVEAHNSQDFTAATVIPDTNQVVFLVSSGYSLMYDYFYKQWSRFTGQFAGLDAVNWRDQTYTVLRPGGQVFTRNNDTFTDGGNPYFLHLQTAPIRLSDALNGFYKVRRVQVLGEYHSPHSLQVSLLYNRDIGPYQVLTFDPSTVVNTDLFGGGTLLGGGDLFGGPLNGSEYLFEFRPKRTKFSTIRFDFTDVISGSAGASYEISEILLDCYILDSANKIGAQRKI